MEKMEGVDSSDYIIVEKSLNRALVPNSEIDMPTSGQDDNQQCNNPYIKESKEEIKEEQAVLYEPDIDQIVAAMKEQVEQDEEMVNQ